MGIFDDTDRLEDYHEIMEEKEEASQVERGVSQLLCEALAIVDGKGRAIPDGSYAVWKGDWQDLRDTIFKAYRISINEEAG